MELNTSSPSRLRRLLAGGLFLLVAQLQVAGQTVGTLLRTPDAFEGATLFAPTSSDTTYLINGCGEVIRKWTSDFNPGMAAYLTPDGDLVRARRLTSTSFAGGGIGGGFERMDWDGNLVWEANYANDTLHAHHDFVWMPNGHLLLVAWEAHPAQEAVARGRLPELTPPVVWSERVVELAPLAGGGMEEVWVWRVWDHLVQNTDPALPHYGEPADHPGRFDVNFEAVATAGGQGPGGGALAAADWMHVNGIDYHPELDQIVLSSRYWNEIWIIDHSTSTAEAAGTTGGGAGRGMCGTASGIRRRTGGGRRRTGGSTGSTMSSGCRRACRGRGTCWCTTTGSSVPRGSSAPWSSGRRRCRRTGRMPWRTGRRTGPGR